MADWADRVQLVLTHYKFHGTAPYFGPDPANIDDLVTDRAPDKHLSAALKAWGVTLHLARAGRGDADGN